MIGCKNEGEVEKVDWFKIITETLNLFKTAMPVALTLLAVYVGHLLTIKRFKDKMLFEKRIELVGDFLARSQINLKYVASLKLEVELRDGALGEAQDFVRLAKQVSFYLSDGSARAVEKYADDFFNAVYERLKENASPQNDYVQFKNKLENMRGKLRKEIAVK